MTKTLLDAKKSRSWNVLLNITAFNILNKLGKRYVENRGHKMAVFANEHIGLHIFSYGVFEKLELETLFDFLKPLGSVFSKGTALDIGANIGNHSVYFSDKFNLIHSFEPHPDTCKVLQFNASFLNNVIVHNIGLGSCEETLRISEDVYNMGASYIRNDGDKKCDGIEVFVKKIDELTIDYSDLCFMKIDVEGFEENVIKGGLGTIEKFKPVIVFEQREEEFRNGKPGAIKLLEGQGYKFCWYEQGPKKSFAFLMLTAKILEVLTGRSHRISTGNEIPAVTHSMLIAVPSKFHETLGLIGKV